MSPVPQEKIPVYVGGFSKPALRRAGALADGWISDLHSTAELAELIPQVLDVRASSARANEPFEIFASCNDAYDLESYSRVEALGATHIVTMPWVFYGAAPDDLEAKLDGIRRFGEDIVRKLA
jgi:hypothetical protein